METAIAHTVLYIPGSSFSVHGARHTMRLNFTNVDADNFDEVLRRLSAVIRQAVTS